VGVEMLRKTLARTEKEAPPESILALFPVWLAEGPSMQLVERIGELVRNQDGRAESTMDATGIAWSARKVAGILGAAVLIGVVVWMLERCLSPVNSNDYSMA
jgi:hypothetical protein